MTFSKIIVVALLVGLLGAAFAGPTGFVIGGLVGGILGAALSKRPPARPPVIPQPQAQLGRPFVPVTVSRSRRNVPLRWVPSGESLAIGDFYIPSGMIYVSDGEPAVEEASNVNLRLPVGQPVRGPAAQLNYYSQYRWLSPDQRATYLEWLAAGRKDEAPASRELGYIFLFFYGLERRLLVEKAQDQEAVAEIVRLIHHYGPYTRSKSLHNYGCQLIHFWGWKQGVEYYAQLLEWMKTLPVSLLGEDEWAIVLASQVLSSKPLPPELGYELVSRDPEARRSVVISRVNEEFRALFSKRYLERFPGGLGLRSAKREARLDYRPASPTLLYGPRDGFSIRVPDVLGLRSQFKPLIGLWNSCVEDLTNYSRAKGKAAGPAASLKAHLALPEELRAAASHPLASRWHEILTDARRDNGCTLLGVHDAARLLEIPQREKLTIGQSRDLAQTIESLGFGVEPDARYDGAYTWDQELGVFKPSSGKVVPPSQSYLGAAVLLKLCVLVAGADGPVASEELEVSHRFIKNNLTLSPEDQERLGALEEALVAHPARAKSSVAQIARRVPKEQCERVGQVLVFVAAADKLVTKDEIRALERIFKALDLSAEKLYAFLEAIHPEFAEVIVQRGEARVPGETIPAPGQPFRLDMARVDKIAQETSEVIGILAKVMVEEAQESQAMPAAGVKPGAEASQVLAAPERASGPTPEWLKSLDLKYHPVLMRLVERDSWARMDFDELVKGFQLMPLDAQDAINEWSDEHLGDFLLEGDDPILIHKTLIP